MAFDPTNPFDRNNWLNVAGGGAAESGDEVEVGAANVAGANDSTRVRTWAANNATLAGENLDTSVGGVGVYGESLCGEFGIGAAGFCANGTGVYGVSQNGIGLVGRAVGGNDIDEPLESLAPRVGVFGQAFDGVGVRGHGGEGFRTPSSEAERNPVPIGAVFSAGLVREAVIPGSTAPQDVSVEPLAQMRLIPSNSDVLPKVGRIGDMYLVIRSDIPARLFICTRIAQQTPIWQQVPLSGTFASGSTI